MGIEMVTMTTTMERQQQVSSGLRRPANGGGDILHYHRPRPNVPKLEAKALFLSLSLSLSPAR